MAKGGFILLSAFLSILLWKTGAGAEVWDLKRCLELGLKQNPRIVAAERAAEASKARVVQFQADYYPTVALRGRLYPFQWQFKQYVGQYVEHSLLGQPVPCCLGIDAKHL